MLNLAGARPGKLMILIVHSLFCLRRFSEERDWPKNLRLLITQPSHTAASTRKSGLVASAPTCLVCLRALGSEERSNRGYSGGQLAANFTRSRSHVLCNRNYPMMQA